MLKRLKKVFQRIIKEARADSEENNRPLHSKLNKNIDWLKEQLEPSADVIYRFFEMGSRASVGACIIFLDNMVNKEALERRVLVALMNSEPGPDQGEGQFLAALQQQLIGIAEITKIRDLEKGLDAILDAQGLLLLDGSTSAIGIGIKKLEIRSISESVTEPVVIGPRDGFIEDLGVNLTLLRRRLKTPSLKVEKYQLGRLSKTDVAIVYLETVTNKKLVEEVKNRLLGIDLDGILASNYLAEYMEDSPWSPFPQLDVSDRPDWVAANLLEGKVAIMIDNAAFTLLVPVVYTQFLHAAEDFYIRYIYASFTRIVRFVAVNIALLLPSFYIAIVTFHQELLPTDLLLSIAAGREPVPFPAFVEALMMEATFEILREAGVRMPRPVGQATSIVGALVIGNAAVSAGLVSPVMVIVVALTALASFVIPSQPAAFSIRILRFPIMFLAAGLGFYGVMLGIMAILIHLSSLRSFGIPYLSPFAPLMLGDFKNAFIRTPWWMLVNRAGYYDLQNSKRQRRGQKPKKPSREGGEER